MKHSICVVIPVFRLKRTQHQNLWYVIKQMLHANLRVLIVEQHFPGYSKALKRKIEQMYDSRVKHMSVHIDDDKIHKSRLINKATQAVSTTHVWVNDADCVMDFNHVLSKLDLSKQFIKPYNKSIDLSTRETLNLLNTNHVTLESSSSIKRRDINMYGALSFIFNRSAFTHVGMMNETFTGWGLEDAEFEHRVTQAGHEPQVIDNVAYHMWHEQHKQNFENWFNPAAKPLNVVKSSTKPSRVIHIVGLMNPDDISCVHVNYRVWMSLQSVKDADRDNVLLLGAVESNDVYIPDWTIEKLPRVFSFEQPLPYINDLLRLALKHAQSGDKILYTNADCMVTPDIYTDILKSNSQAIEYHRRECHPHDSVLSCLNNTHHVEKHGVDGFMFTYQTLERLIDDIPEMVVGQPCWDLVLSKLLKKYKPVVDDTKLCHIEHEKNWSLKNPTDATHHNVELARPYLNNTMFVEYDSRHKYTDELCVMVLCCAKEIQAGRLRRMLNHFFTYECSVDKKFDVFICVDTIDKSTNNLLHEQTQTIMDRCDNINNMIIHDVDIPPGENMFMYSVDEWYTRRAKDPTCLQLGTTSGVNIQFFESVKHVFQVKQQYKHLLLLETDCEPISTRWYDRVADHCSREDFVVMGSKYRGVDDSHRSRWYRDHLNGVAVYKNTSDLFRLLDRASQVIKNHVNDPNTIERWLNFDVAMLQAAIDLTMVDKLVDADIISNYSDPASGHLDIENVLSRDINTIILHKKQHETI